MNDLILLIHLNQSEVRRFDILGNVFLGRVVDGSPLRYKVMRREERALET